MDKNTLAERLTAELTEEEWEALRSGIQSAPVSAYNRKVLLRLKDSYATFSGEVDDARIEEMRGELQTFLANNWAEQPDAHRYVILACTALTFIYGMPMHPQHTTGYYTSVKDGEASYFCPAREEGTVCDYCLARSAEPLYGRWEKKCAETLEKYGEKAAELQAEIYRAGFLESGVIAVKDLRYYDSVRDMCVCNQCGKYGTTWACPPAVGSIEECRSRAERYGSMMLFSKAYMLTDDFDFEGMLEAGHDFKKCARALDRTLKDKKTDYMILSNESCDICRECTYPDDPCRFPDKMQHALEGYGFNVSELAGMAGISYINGKLTVTYFGAVLF